MIVNKHFFFLLFAYLQKQKKQCGHLEKNRLGTWDIIKQFNTATFVCLSKAWPWISNFICHGFFCVLFVKMRSDCLFC